MWWDNDGTPVDSIMARFIIKVQVQQQQITIYLQSTKNAHKNMSCYLVWHHDVYFWPFIKGLFFVELDFIVVLNGNSSILALHDHTDKLTSPTFHVEYWDRHGPRHNQNGTMEQHRPRGCHYRGKIRNHRGYSHVALSNCNGLSGLIQRDHVQYFIEPLWNVTHVKAGQPHPHVIYQPVTDIYKCLIITKFFPH